VCQFDQCGHRPRAADAQQLGRDAECRRPCRGGANRVQILLVGQRHVVGRDHDGERGRRQRDHVGEDQPGSDLERGVDRHALGGWVDAHRQRPEQHRPRAGPFLAQDFGSGPPAIQQLAHRAGESTPPARRAARPQIPRPPNVNL